MKKTTLFITQAGVIAAAYVALTFVSSGFAFGDFQFRLSEALTILPAFTPAAIPGLAVGCLIGNLASPYGVLDIIIGSLATLLAAVFSRMLSKICIKGLPVLSPLPPVLFNAAAVGVVLTMFSDAPSGMLFLYSAFTVGVCEAAVCFGLGLPLAAVLKKTKIF